MLGDKAPAKNESVAGSSKGRRDSAVQRCVVFSEGLGAPEAAVPGAEFQGPAGLRSYLSVFDREICDQ